MEKIKFVGGKERLLFTSERHLKDVGMVTGKSNV